MAKGMAILSDENSLITDSDLTPLSVSYTQEGFVAKLQGMNLKEVSIKSGIPYATVHGISKGTINPRMITAVKLTKYLGSLPC